MGCCIDWLWKYNANSKRSEPPAEQQLCCLLINSTLYVMTAKSLVTPKYINMFDIYIKRFFFLNHHYPFPLFLFRVVGVLEHIMAVTGQREGIKPGQLSSPPEGTHTIHVCTHTYGQFRAEKTLKHEENENSTHPQARIWTLELLPERQVCLNTASWHHPQTPFTHIFYVITLKNV